MSKSTIPANEEAVSVRIFVKKSEIEALKRITESGVYPAATEKLRSTICQRVCFAFDQREQDERRLQRISRQYNRRLAKLNPNL